MAQPVPPQLATLATRARLDGPITTWCRGEFVAGRPGGYAVAVSSPTGGGRYLLLHDDARVTELARFTTGAELSCYSRAAAAKLDASIRQSETIEGQVKPRWRTTVVCGFTDDTTAVCWQYSPAERTLVKVGGWIT
jgi:hypothetical protein